MHISEEPKDFYFSNDVHKAKNSVTQHYHEIYEIYYLKSGCCNYFIDDTLYELRAGDIVFIPNGIIHNTNYSGAHTRRLINCSADYIPESILERTNELPRLYRNKRLTQEAERIFTRIEEEYTRADGFSRDALKCYTGELFFLFLRSEGEPHDTAERKSVAQRAAKYARENYCSQIGLTDTALRLSVTAEHLSRSFKREIGFGFSEYLIMLRLQKAEYMLKNEPGRSISEIAFACGFNDSNYFSDKFKKAYGIPPSRLKRK